MEIRLFDVLNNKVDVSDYMFIHEGKIMVNADHVYDVILDTEKDTLHQQLEMFDSKEEMFRKAQAFDRIKDIHSDYSIGDAKCIEMIAYELERVDGER